MRDQSGHGHDGKPELDLGLPEIVESDGGQAVRLGGAGTIDCGAVADFDREDPYSVGAWFKPRGDGYENPGGDDESLSIDGFDFAFDGHVVCYFVSQWEGSAIRISTRSSYPNDTWHHAICTYDGSSRSSGFKIYVDGAQAPFDASHDNLTASTNESRLFSDRFSSRRQDYFNGDIDDVFVYQRALSAEEARAWFTRGRSPNAETLDG